MHVCNLTNKCEIMVLRVVISFVHPMTKVHPYE